MSPLPTFRFSTDLLGHYRWLSQQDLTVIDVETTGSRPPHHRVIEISVLRTNLRDGILDQQTHLLQPGVAIPERIVQFTGITPAMLTNAATPEQIWPSLLPLLSNGILTAHNIQFDYSFLQAEYSRLQLAYHRDDADLFCTVRLARLMLADLPSRSLPDLVQHFQFPIAKSHRAAADTLACWYLAQHLLTRIQNDDEQTLLDCIGQEWLPIQMVTPLFGCSRRRAKAMLEAAGVPTRSSRRRKAPMYRRQDIEQFYWQRQEGLAASGEEQLVGG
ncbi:MAG: 3'-5' exonuclease [Thainema sp.]